jgi:hypothetical protein
MLEKIKILVVSSLMAEYKNIKGILNPLKAFELDYTNNIRDDGNNYDFIILDLDSIQEDKAKGVLDVFTESNCKSKIILISSIEKGTLITKTKKSDDLIILPKSTLKDNLIDCIYKLIIQGVEFI